MMRLRPFLLADLEPSDLITSFQKLDPASKEAFIIIGATAVLAGLLVAWAAWMRKPRRRHHEHHSSHRHHSNGESHGEPVPAVAEAGSAGSGRHRWRRRRRRDHRPRNPTLAETGGLPPVRTDDPPPAPGA